jgi:hypothetical protein
MTLAFALEKNNITALGFNPISRSQDNTSRLLRVPEVVVSGRTNSSAINKVWSPIDAARTWALVALRKFKISLPS